MQACQYVNHQVGRSIDIYGIVTNGEGWKFHCFNVSGEVKETLLHGIADMPLLLGTVRTFFQRCSEALSNKTVDGTNKTVDGKGECLKRLEN